MNIKFLFPLIGFAAGIFISADFFHGLSFALITIGAGLLFWLIISLLSKNPLRALKIHSFHTVWITILFCGIGALDYNLTAEPVIPFELEGKKFNFTGVIEDVKYLADGDRFKVKILSLSDSNLKYNCKNLSFLLKTDGFVGSKGDVISFQSKAKKFKKISPNLDYEKIMLHQGINYQGNALVSNIEKINVEKSFNTHISSFRNDLLVKLEKSSLNRPTSEFLISLLLGDKSLLSSDVKKTLTSAGLAHVLALSGMHVAIILSIILGLLFPLSLFGLHKERKLIAVGCIWIFVFITGAAPSTLRAAIMVSFLMGAYLLERKNSALNALLAATLFILIFNPLALWDIGFQLSFFCVASIILFAQKLNPIDRHVHPKTFKLANIILISLITSFSTWVLIAYYFHAVPLLFLPSNILLLPFLPIFVASGLIHLLLLYFGIDWSVLSKFLNLFYETFVGSANWLSSYGKSNIYINNVTIPTLFLWILGILSLAWFLNSSQKRYKKIAVGVSCTMLALSLIFIIPSSQQTSSSLKFHHNFSKIEATHAKNNMITKLEFPRNSISHSNFDSFHILAVDQYLIPDSIDNLKTSQNDVSKFLIIGAGADTHQIAQLINSSQYTRIILHPGVGKNKKAELFRLIDDANLDKIYSLGENGSLEFEL